MLLHNFFAVNPFANGLHTHAESDEHTPSHLFRQPGRQTLSHSLPPSLPGATVRRLLSALVLAFICLAWSPSPASAHTDLLSTDPASGARLAAPPAEVTLTFTDQMSGEFNTVSLTVADQTPIKLGSSTVSDTVTARVPLDDIAGAFRNPNQPVDWTLAYRVVSADGHPVTGDLAFRAPLPRAASAGTSPTTTPSTPGLSEPGSLAPGSSTIASTPRDDSSPSNATDDDRSPWWVALLGFALALLIAAGAAITLLKQHTRGRAGDG